MAVSVLLPIVSLFLSSSPPLLAQFSLPLGPNRRSSFVLGIENGLNSFPFGHRFSSISPPFSPFADPFGYSTASSAVGHPPGFNSFPFPGGLFRPFVGAPFASHYAANKFLRESLFDRDNFQAHGCGWEMSRESCVNLLGICKGGCEDFSPGGALFRDCRCVPIGYSALLMGR